MFDANKLLNAIFGTAGGKNQLGEIGGMLGGLLNDSVAGMKEGAAAIEQKTGIGAKANEALKDATGKSGGDLFEQAKAFATENKVAAGVGWPGAQRRWEVWRWWAGLPTRPGRTIRLARHLRRPHRSRLHLAPARSARRAIPTRTTRPPCWCCVR